MRWEFSEQTSWLVAAALALTPACSRAVEPKTDAAAPPTTDSPEYAIVWGDSAKGPRSYWLEFARGQVRIRAELSGALFLVGGRIYRFQTEEKVQRVLNACPDPNAEPNDAEATADDNHREVTVFGAEAERLDESERVQIVSPPTVENATQFDNTITLRASAGPYLFVDSSSDALYCGGVHDAREFSSDTFDLASRKFVSLLTEPELLELRGFALKDQRAILVACLADHNDATGHPLASDQLSELEVRSALPSLDSSGKLVFQIDLGMMRSYVEGQVSCLVTVERVPASLSRLTVPRALHGFIQHEPKTTVHGWSVLAPSELPRVPTIDRVFAERARLEQ